MVMESRSDVQNYLYDISQLRERKKVLEGEVYDDAALFIEETIRYSTRMSFKNFPFYKLLPSRIRLKLVQSVLNAQIQQLRFFFEDITDY